MKRLIVLLSISVLLYSCKVNYTIISKSNCELHKSGIICHVNLRSKKGKLYEKYIKTTLRDSSKVVGSKIKLSKREVEDNIHAYKIPN